MRKLIIIFVLFITVFSACKRNIVYEQEYKFKGGTWNYKDTVVFTFPADTGFYDIYFNIKHLTNYPYKNLWLFVHIVAPNGLQEIDTVNVFLADDKGRWLGEGMGKKWEYKFLFKENVGFIQGGNYTIKVIQGLRAETVPMQELDLIIEKYRNNGKK